MYKQKIFLKMKMSSHNYKNFLRNKIFKTPYLMILMQTNKKIKIIKKLLISLKESTILLKMLDWFSKTKIIEIKFKITYLVLIKK